MSDLKLSSSSSKGDFKVLEGTRVICEVVYKNWFSSKATTNLNQAVLEIQPKNIWTRLSEVTSISIAKVKNDR